MSWFGLDIGGANLKAADGRGWSQNVPFPLWREPGGLSAAVASLLAAAPPAERVAVTMTGELCDAFRTKAEGVRHIIAAVQQASANRDVRVYLLDGRFATVAEANESPQLAAASNWLALARYACRLVARDPAVLIDIGSTTTDIVPLANGEPRPSGLNDTERLLAGELVYTGVGRTPVCAVTDWLPWRGARCPVAAELFATTADAYVMLGDLPERAERASTADGRPLTMLCAQERLARMICADATSFDREEAIQAARRVRDAQVATITRALQRVVSSQSQAPATYVLGGAGEFLARRVIAGVVESPRLVSLTERLGSGCSECGPAFAVATLARESNA